MANAFRCDPVLAGQVSDQLADVRRALLDQRVSLGDTGTGSARVDAALREFFRDSSDNRKHMGELLERSSGLLRALADGATEVDTQLARALPDLPPPAVQSVQTVEAGPVVSGRPA